jgi:hypothetical protein
MGNARQSRVLRCFPLMVAVTGCAAVAPAPCPVAPVPTGREATVDAREKAGSVAPTAIASAEGTWLFRCCDGASTWMGMIVLVRAGTELRGGFLTDPDGPESGSHASYLEGRIEGDRVRLARRWRTGSVRHEQFYDLALTGDGVRLAGTFTEPAFDPAPHGIQLERGFTPVPRTEFAVPANGSKESATGAKREQSARDSEPRRDPARPCDCRLVCYCGGVPPGKEHYDESARCGGSCKCPVCPPLP